MPDRSVERREGLGLCEVNRLSDGTGAKAEMEDIDSGSNRGLKAELNGARRGRHWGAVAWSEVEILNHSRSRWGDENCSTCSKRVEK